MSGKPAVVLMHGILMSGNAWQEVAALLADRHQVYQPTALGHRGGPRAHRRPVTVGDLVDATERYLDEHGLERPHLVGLSLGGWMAFELARRGRAATVCVLAPAGFWSFGDSAQTHVKKQVHKFVTMGRIARPVRPAVALTTKSATVRRLGFRGRAPCRSDYPWPVRRPRRRHHRLHHRRRRPHQIRAADRTAGPAAVPGHHRVVGERRHHSGRGVRRDRPHADSPGVVHHPARRRAPPHDRRPRAGGPHHPGRDGRGIGPLRGKRDGTHGPPQVLDSADRRNVFARQQFGRRRGHRL